MSSIPRLASFARDVYSQGGEDGIVEEIFRRLTPSIQLNYWCIEFGAWDGVRMSNTCNLIRHNGWHGVLIEGDRRRADSIARNLAGSHVLPICQQIGFTTPNTLEEVIAHSGCPSDCDFLSIDIDGCDIHILATLRQLQPKVICIEYNNTIPNDIDFEQPADFSIRQGASAAAIQRVAGDKGYTLAEATRFNLFLVRNDLTPFVVGSTPPVLADIRDDSLTRCVVFAGFDGTIFLSRPFRLPCHPIDVDAGAIQVLPKYIRRFTGDYSIPQKVAFVCWYFCRDPRGAVAWLKARLGRKK